MSRNRRSALVPVAVLLICLVVDSQSLAASFLGLGDIAGGPTSSTSAAISPDGTFIVGTSTGPDNRNLPFRWSATTGMQAIAGPAEGQYRAFSASSVSADGSTVVGVATVDSGIGIDQAARFTEYGTPPAILGAGAFGSPAAAYDVSSDASFVVGRQTVFGAFNSDAFRLDTGDDSWISLGNLTGGFDDNSSAFAVSADGGVVVGSSTSVIGQEAFRWTEAGGMVGLGTLPSYLGTSNQAGALEISSDGQTIVGYSSNGQYLEAFRWTEATGMVGLGDFEGGFFDSRAQAVSASGFRIVGRGADESGQRAFLWDPANGMQELDILLSSLGIDLTGWTLTNATGISDDGNTITGNGINPDGFSEAWIATIPEPSTGLLLAIGLAGLGIARR